MYKPKDNLVYYRAIGVCDYLAVFQWQVGIGLNSAHRLETDNSK